MSPSTPSEPPSADEGRPTGAEQPPGEGAWREEWQEQWPAQAPPPGYGQQQAPAPPPGYGQSAPPGYGYPAPPGYGAPGQGAPGYGQPYPPYYAPPGWASPPDHPRSTLALVFGLIGLIGGFTTCFGFVFAPFAWAIGAKAVKEIDAAPGQYSGRGNAQAGKVLGIIGTVLLVIAVLAVAGLITLAIAADSSGGFSSGGTGV